MTDHPIIQSRMPFRVFDNFGNLTALKVFPDGRRMAANSSDGMLRVWDFKKGVLLKELEMRGERMRDLAISRDGKLIVGSDKGYYLTAWDGDTGRRLIQVPEFCLSKVYSFDISPDGATLAIGNSSLEVTLRNTATWQLQGEPIKYRMPGIVSSVRYSPSGQFLAIAAMSQVRIWDPTTGKHIATLNQANSPVWTPDSTRLLTVCYGAIQQWDSSTWKPLGSSICMGDTRDFCVAVNCNSTVVAFPTTQNRVRLWHLVDCRTIALFQLSQIPCCITFSVDGKHIFTGGEDQKISVWAVPENAWPEDNPNDQVTNQAEEWHTRAQGPDSEAQDSDSMAQDPSSKVQDCNSVSKIITMSAAVRSACISGDLATAEELLTQEIDANGKSYHSYANRSFVLARKLDWDNAFKDAMKSLGIQPSLIGYISKGIALYGSMQFQDAERAFDLSFTFANGDSTTSRLIFIIKAIALFNAGRHAEAMRRVRNLAFSTSSPDPNTIIIGCGVIEGYLFLQLGNNALAHNRPSEAARHFDTAAISTTALLTRWSIDSKYEDLVVLFGCDLNASWQIACQKRCHALLRAGELAKLIEAFQYMVKGCDNEAKKASCLDWSIGFMQELTTFLGHPPNADATPGTRKYDDENYTISDIDNDSDSDIGSGESYSTSENASGVPCQVPKFTDKA